MKKLATMIIGATLLIGGSMRAQENETKTFKFGNAEFKMILVSGGTFEMGETKTHPELNREDPTTCMVTLSDFYIGETEVTQGLWYEVMGNCPAYFQGDEMLPMESVSWSECVSFIKSLNYLLGTQFRLPTEAEWEFAARGGNESKGYGWSGSNDPDDVAWYDLNSNNRSHPVKTKAPNELGIYDMSGNVWEWCSDRYADYTATPKTNPKGALSGALRIDRGGSWFNRREKTCVTHRGIYSANFKNKFTGFRLAASVAADE